MDKEILSIEKENDDYDDDKLLFGLTIPQGWRGGGNLSLEERNDPIKQYEFSKSIAIAADNLGFDMLYAYDHFIRTHKEDVEKNIFECFTLLSAIATITTKIKIGQIVTCNSYRNPALLSKMISTLDVISKGRIELGIGAGWHEDEYIAYGYDFPSNTTRVRQLDESLSIIKSLWTEKRTYFDGRYYKINNAICNPKPIQKPHPLIMVGGRGEKYLLKVVAKHADRYNLFFGSPEEMKRKISILKQYCNSIGRDHNEIQYSVVLPCIVEESEEKIDKILTKINKTDQTKEQLVQYLVDGIAIGTPEKIIKGLNEYVDLGVNHFIIHFKELNDITLKLFYSKVIRKI